MTIRGIWTADLIVKYAPENYDERGIYRKDEWTSLIHIGKVDDGKRFTREEYLETEDKYVQAVIRGMELAGCSFLTVEYLSIHRNKSNMKRFTPKDPKDPLHEQNKALYDMFLSIKEGMRIHISQIEKAVRLNLREFMNCDLTNKKKDFYVRFGFDYYMYFNSNIDKCILKKRDRENRSVFQSEMTRTRTRDSLRLAIKYFLAIL